MTFHPDYIIWIKSSDSSNMPFVPCSFIVHRLNTNRRSVLRTKIANLSPIFWSPKSPRLPHSQLGFRPLTLAHRLHFIFIKVIPSYEFWWATTGKPLASLLEWASYPPHLRNLYLSFYRRSIIPEFGSVSESVSEESVTSSLTLSVPQKSVCMFLEQLIAIA